MSTYDVHPPTTSTATVAHRPLWQVGAFAAIVAAVAAELFVVVAKAMDVPMEATGPGQPELQEIPTGGFAFSVVLWTAVGTVLAMVLARRAKQPARTFVVTTVALTLLSFVSPLIAAGESTTATVAVLLATHVLVAAIVIPALARRLQEQQDEQVQPAAS